MVGRRRKVKRKQWLKDPKVVPQKTNLDQNINDSKSHIWNSFIENIISDTTTFLCSSTCSSGHHHSIFWDLKANKNYRDRSLILQYGFAQNASFILRTSTHLTLKIICFRNLPKTFITVQFFSKHVSVCCQKNICAAPFLDTQELQSWSTLKANACIFLYI